MSMFVPSRAKVTKRIVGDNADDGIDGEVVAGVVVAGASVLGVVVRGVDVLGVVVRGVDVLGVVVAGASVLGVSVLGVVVTGASVLGVSVLGASDEQPATDDNRTTTTATMIRFMERTLLTKNGSLFVLGSRSSSIGEDVQKSAMTAPASAPIRIQHGFETPMAGCERRFVTGVVISMTIGPLHVGHFVTPCPSAANALRRFPSRPPSRLLHGPHAARRFVTSYGSPPSAMGTIWTTIDARNEHTPGR